MAEPTHRYSARPTRNPFRYLGAVWRLVTRDPSTVVDDAAVVQIGFSRSRLGRRFARWEEAAEGLRRDPRTAEALRARRSFAPIVLDDLERLPEGSLGRVFARHCRTRDLDPNLVRIPDDDETGWVPDHLYATHDIWHVVSGWDTDLRGEVGLAAFMSAQLGSPTFFGYNVALIFLNVVWRRADLDEIFAAFSAGYRSGRRTDPFFGVDWQAEWATPLEELRARLRVDPGEAAPESIAA